MNDTTSANREPQDEDHDLDLRDGLLPIREVTRQTGVNAVTLRAWERRYGLIVPHRTPKGHRLYTRAHVQRVLNILIWLDRGVSVGQVKQLLDARQPAAHPPSDDWLALRANLVDAIECQAERRLDDLVNQAMSLYPPRTLNEQLLSPLLAELGRRWQGQFGAQLERAFFHAWLRSKLGARLYHNNRTVTGAPVLLVNHSDLPMDPHLWLTAWLISSNDCPVEVFDISLPPDELALACGNLSARALVLYASKSLTVSQLPRLLTKVECPVVLAGPAVTIHREQLSGQRFGIERLLLAENPIDAHQRLLHAGVI